jgi:hypothetical protein
VSTLSAFLRRRGLVIDKCGFAYPLKFKDKKIEV